MHGKFPIAHLPMEVETLDFRRIIDFLLRRWRLVAATAAVVTALTILVLMALTPRYTSTAQILLDLKSEKSSGIDAIIADAVTDNSLIDSQISILESSSLLGRVVDSQNLVNDPEFGTPQDAGRPWYALITDLIFPKGDTTATADQLAALQKQAAVGRLWRALDVQRVQRTYVVTISVTSIDPQKAARLANAVADAFVVDQLEARYEAAKTASDWLSGRLQTLRETLRKSEEAVEQFRSQYGLVATATGTINEQQLSEINANLVSARADAAEKRAKYDQAQRLISEGGNVQTIPDVIKSPVVASLRGQQADVTRREADLVTRYGERHPLVVNVRAERREIERQISAEVTRIIANLKNDYDVANSRVDSLTLSVQAATGQTGSDNALAIKLRELDRDATANRTLYEAFLTQSKTLAEQSTVQSREARLITPAVASTAPSFPKKTLFTALGGVAGVFLGLGLAVTLEMLSSGFTSPKQLEEATGLPVLASIEYIQPGELPAADGTILPIARFLLEKPLSRFSESMRSLRAGLQMSDVDNPPKVIQVASAVPGEGKTLISIALATSMAASGKRVVLLDCDLRRPALTERYGLNERPGIVQLLTQTTSPEGILHQDTASGVYVLPAGGRSQSPPDLLGSARMAQLIEQLRNSFDYVILDAPPLGPVIDATVLSHLSDKVVYVVRWSSTSRELVQQALGQVHGERKVAGFALNMIDIRNTPKYGPYSYYSSNYYKQYYVQ